MDNETNSEPGVDGKIREGQSFLTLEMVAERLGLHYQFIYREVRSGALPAVRFGRVYRIDEADLLSYIKARKHSSPGSLAPGGGTCQSCGRHFRSDTSLKDACVVCGQPICVDCWTRGKVRRCREHSAETGEENDGEA